MVLVKQSKQILWNVVDFAENDRIKPFEPLYGVASPAKTLNITSTGVEHVVSRCDVFYLCNRFRVRLLTARLFRH